MKLKRPIIGAAILVACFLTITSAGHWKLSRVLPQEYILIITGSLGVVIGIVLAFVMSKSLTTEIRTLAATARIVAEGDLTRDVPVNTTDEAVTWGRSRAQGLTVLNVGSRDQRVLNRPGDDLRIDWGYFHLAVPDEAGACHFVAGCDAQLCRDRLFARGR